MSTPLPLTVTLKRLAGNNSDLAALGAIVILLVNELSVHMRGAFVPGIGFLIEVRIDLRREAREPRKRAHVRDFHGHAFGVAVAVLPGSAGRRNPHRLVAFSRCVAALHARKRIRQHRLEHAEVDRLDLAAARDDRAEAESAAPGSTALAPAASGLPPEARAAFFACSACCPIFDRACRELLTRC